MYLTDVDKAPSAEVAQTAPEAAACADPASVVKSAMAALNQGEQDALALGSLIDVKGRNSDNAAGCRSLVSDYLLCLNDLQTVLSLVESGDGDAAEHMKRIPGIVAALQESFDMALSGMKEYTKRDGTRGLPAYIKEVCLSLSKSSYAVFNSLSPLSEVLGVRMQTWNGVNAVGNYKFHETKKPVAKAAMAQALPAEAAQVLHDFTPVEDGWFESEAAPAVALKEKRGGFLGRIMGVFGDVASVGRSLPRTALLGALLAGCVGDSPSDTPSIPDGASLPDTAQSLNETVAAPTPAAPKFQVAEGAPTLWHAIRGELRAECGLSGKALERETGTLVHAALKEQNTGFTGIVKGMKEGPHPASRLINIQGDLAKYSVSVGDSYDSVLGDVVQTGQVGAYGMDNGPTGTITLYGNAAFADYVCPAAL